MSNMTAYKLTHRITIQQDISDGTDDADWQNLFTNLWAAKKGNTGSRYYQAATSQNSNESVFTIHWTKAYAEQIRPTMRIFADGDTNEDHALEITSLPIDVDDAHQWLEIHAKDSRQNAG